MISIGRDSDLFFAEAYWFERKVRFHLDFATLRDQLPAIAAKRVVVSPHVLRTCYRAIKPLLPAANWLRMGWSSTSLDARAAPKNTRRDALCDLACRHFVIRRLRSRRTISLRSSVDDQVAMPSWSKTPCMATRS